MWSVTPFKVSLFNRIIDAGAVEASAKFWRGASYKRGGGGTGQGLGQSFEGGAYLVAKWKFCLFKAKFPLRD